MGDLFFGLFSVVGKGRPNRQLRFRKPIYTRNENGTIVLYYEPRRTHEKPRRP